MFVIFQHHFFAFKRFIWWNNGVYEENWWPLQWHDDLLLIASRFSIIFLLCLEVHRTSSQLWLKAHRHVGHQLDSEKPQITIKKRKLNVNTFFQKQVLHLAFDRNKKTHRRK